MSRIVVLTFCLLVSCLCLGCEQSASGPSQKIGVVNINHILVDSEPGRAAAKYMENLQDSLREQANALQQKMLKAEQESKENDPKKEAVQKEVQVAYMQLQTKLQSEQQNINSILNDLVHRVVEKYRKENGFSIIIFSDVALSFEDKVDVTSGITAAMNKEKVEFKPLPEPEAAKPEGEKTESPAKAPEAKDQKPAPNTK